MNLIEITMAMLVFSLTANASLQLWSSSARTSQANAERQETWRRVDADLLRREHGLRRAARVLAETEAPAPDPGPGGSTSPAEAADRCLAAASWMAGQLEASAGVLPAGVSRQLIAAAPGGDGLWLVYRLESSRLERRRLFTAAAHGLCPPADTAADSDGDGDPEAADDPDGETEAAAYTDTGVGA